MTNQDQEVLQLLSQILSPNTNQISQATQVLKIYIKKPQAAHQLVQLLKHEDMSYRQLIIILLKKIQKNNINMDKNLFNQLFQFFSQEKISLIQKNMAGLLGNFYSNIPFQQIQPQLENLEQNKSLLFLTSYVEYGGKIPQETMLNLMKNNQDSIIIENTIKIVAYQIQSCDEINKNWFCEQYKFILQKGGELAELWFDTLVMALEMKEKGWVTIFEVLSQELFNKALLDKQISNEVKEMCLDLLTSVSELKRSILTKNQQLTNQILDVLFTSIVYFKEEDDQDEVSYQDSLLGTIENLSHNLPKNKIFKQIMHNISTLINSKNDQKIFSGFKIFSHIISGCSEKLKSMLPQLMQMLSIGFQSQNPKCKKVTIYCISAMTEYLNPEIYDYHSQLIPALLNELNINNTSIVEQSMSSLDLFCEYLQRKILGHLPQLVPIIHNVLISNHTSNRSKQLALACFGSLAIGCKFDLVPFLPQFVPSLVKIVDLQITPENTMIIAECYQTLGKIASNSQTKEEYLTWQSIEVKVYNSLINIDDPSIREASLAFFYNIARVLKEDFALYTEKLVGFTLKLAESNESVVYETKNPGSLDLDSESEEDPDIAKVKMAYLDEKVSAICALGHFACASPKAFGPYFEKTLSMLDANYNFFQEYVRVETIVCYKHILEAMLKYQYGTLPKYEKCFPVINRLDQKIESFIQIDLISKFQYWLDSDPSNEVVSSAIDCIREILELIGPILMEHWLPDLSMSLKTLLQGNGACQIPLDDGEDNQDQETDIKVFEAITDLFPVMGKILKKDLQPIFLNVFDSLILYFEKEDFEDIIQSIGVIAESFKVRQFIQHAPNCIPNVAQKLIPKLLKNIELEDEAVVRNTVYCFGVMFSKNPVMMGGYFSQILGYIQTAFESCQLPQVKDNIVSALCKLIMHDQNKKIPVQQALQRILQQMPFRGDTTEQKSAMKFLIFLYKTSNQLFMENIDQITGIITECLASSSENKLKVKFLKLFVQEIVSITAQNENFKNKFEVLFQDQEKVLNMQETKKNLVLSMFQ